jgi:hypothetical protein
MLLKSIPDFDGPVFLESVAAEIHLLACGYSAQSTVRDCRVRATPLARYTIKAGRFSNENCASDMRPGPRPT